MVTVVNNPGPNVNDSDSGAGWAVAIIILLVVVGGLFWYFRYYRTAAPATAPATTIQVNVPTSGTPAPASSPTQ